jgi:hypothetical protein
MSTSKTIASADVTDPKFVKRLNEVKRHAQVIGMSVSATALALKRFVNFMRQNIFSLSHLRLCTQVFNDEIQRVLGLVTFACVFRILIQFTRTWQDAAIKKSHECRMGCPCCKEFF